MDSGILGVGFEYVFLCLLVFGKVGPGLAGGWDVLTRILLRVRFYILLGVDHFLVFAELVMD